MSKDTAATPKSAMDSTFPVLLPEDPALFLSGAEFTSYVHKLLSTAASNTKPSTDTEDALANLDIESSAGDDLTVIPGSSIPELPSPAKVTTGDTSSKFWSALKDASTLEQHGVHLAAENKLYTENMGIAHVSTTSPLLDLFCELEKTVSPTRLQELIAAAWKVDSLATLEIVWNARSIHLGKGEQESFYRCLGWIKAQHPETALRNLPWLFRPVIEKKVKKEDDEDAMVVIEKEEVSADTKFNVPYGVSHGYWKDLLNILVLAVNDELGVLGHINEMFHTHTKNKQADISQSEAKTKKHLQEKSRHEAVLKKLKDPFYHALHLSVARLFADELRKDMDLMKSGSREDLRKISLAAKWAPSSEGFHDKHTIIASSIAEILYPMSEYAEPGDSRELYLKRARELYRRLTLSPLRKALEVVERDVTAETFSNINYSKVPSIAMDNYKALFLKKDLDGFEKFIEKVAEGKSRISGAVLLPGNLIQQARNCSTGFPKGKPDRVKHLLYEKLQEISGKALDGQWAAIVKRIKDSGKLSSSIAVCDVSGSMLGPRFPDCTTPMDTSVGLSLLLAEVTEPPFGGSFITFSDEPQILDVGGPSDARTLVEKVEYMVSSQWNYNTDFTAVFERLILPLAVRHKLKQEDMVKQIFVFSDMQFDAAEKPGPQFETAYERIKRKYAQAGYEMPKLIFWNIAGGRAGYTGYGDPVAPKPVTSFTDGTILVSGYSQAMLKMFLENGHFDDEVGDEEVEDEEVAQGEDDEQEGLVELKAKKRKVDPMAGLWKAIGHKAYSMLEVVD
ncbi:hypothetical protein MMC13_002577 [Lambiella insularis]|nr:hypothetical protein [Lambiella insularis]